MKTPICEQLGIETPIFAFTHCRDTVVAASKAGGIGILGAVGFSLEQLKTELDWIEEHIDGMPYGVDIIIPEVYEGQDALGDPEALMQQLEDAISDEHRIFVANMLARYGVPELSEGMEETKLRISQSHAESLMEEAISRPNCRTIVNALGTPPASVIKRVQDSGRLIGALCGKPEHAIQHKKAGLDFVVAQGTEGGGHSGEIASMVLWPQVVDAVAPLPVIAAGGIGDGRQMLAAMVLGAQGVWAGSLWLAVREGHAQDAEKQSYFDANSSDTVRSRCWTGKTVRVLKNEWWEAWEQPEAPAVLPMPLQSMLTQNAMQRTHVFADVNDTTKIAFSPVGQVVGQITQEESTRDVIFRLLNEFSDALDQVNHLIDESITSEV